MACTNDLPFHSLNNSDLHILINDESFPNFSIHDINNQTFHPLLTNSLTYGDTFKRYRNTLTRVIKCAKANYFKSKLQEYAGNIRKTWDFVNEILNRSRRTNNQTAFIFNNNVTSDPRDIADGFNEYFSTIASNLSHKPSQHHNDFTKYLPSPSKFSLRLSPVSHTELSVIIKSLKHSAPGHDDISSEIIKECASEIIPHLKDLINKSFKTGIFPSHLQIAKVVPIYKKGDKTLPGNYRPISILSSFSKIFEKVVCFTMYESIDRKSISSYNILRPIKSL
ncbi:uncharacterized protein LOC119598012 [Penaeus monodon]|uniref:uncharacterized protein LOC119598012 n=1 Tax=Penaeus monodon TaxID=6687 RepID=UPI0018A793EE|nr:uncharacterized protein LOC119598012 [Penaeus monodon]